MSPPGNARTDGQTSQKHSASKCRIKVGAIDAACSIRPIQEIGPRPRTRITEVFSTLVAICLVGTVSGKSLQLLPPDATF